MYLAIDFGASRVKSIYFENSKKIINYYETNGSIYNDKNGIVKITFFKDTLIKHLSFYEKKKMYYFKNYSVQRDAWICYLGWKKNF